MSAFRSRDFRLYQVARLIGIVAAEAQAVAVAWQIYQITHSALALGYTGLVLFLPGVVFMLAAGHAADRYDRREVILVCYALQIVSSALLLTLAWRGTRNVWPIYTVLFFIGTGRAFSGPASSALLPHLVPEADYVNAVTWGSTVFHIANIAGPAIGGLLFTLPLPARFSGAVAVYIFTLAGLLVFWTLIASLSVRPGRMEKRAASVHTLLAGFRFVFERKMILGATSLDLFAVLLGGAVALLPVYAVDILHAGPQALGSLRAAPALGGLSVSLWMVWRPIRRRAGALMFLCVAIFGAATIVFGFSRSILLSMAALFVVGASDMVSVVVRTALVQLATPAAMRGRVSAVNSLFVGASNELGEFESGLTAHWLGAVRAVVFGGVGSVLITALWSVFFPSLREADALTSEALGASYGEQELEEETRPAV